MSALAGLFEPGSFHVNPQAMAEAVRELKNSTSAALEASRVVTSTSCLLFGFTVTNSKGSAQFVQIFDSATLPADTAVPIAAFNVAADSFVSASWVPYPRSFRNGLVICNSSTQETKTIGSADCLFDVQYL